MIEVLSHASRLKLTQRRLEAVRGRIRRRWAWHSRIRGGLLAFMLASLTLSSATVVTSLYGDLLTKAPLLSPLEADSWPVAVAIAWMARLIALGGVVILVAVDLSEERGSDRDLQEALGLSKDFELMSGPDGRASRG